MPTRTFTKTDAVITSNGYTSGPTGNIPPISININGSFDASIIGSAASTTTDLVQAFVYSINQQFNFQTFPAIPLTAKIIKIRVNRFGSSSFNASINAGSAIISLDSLQPTPNGAILPASGNPTIVSGDATTGWVTLYEAVNPDFLTYNQLVATYGTIGITFSIVNASVNGDNPNSREASYNLEYTNYHMEITYDLENYSWYIKPTKKIVNGLPVTAIEDVVTDIIPLTDEEVAENGIPDGYIFYGTGDAFPDGPDYVWWESEDFWEMYILSPINPSIPGITTWTSLPGAPTCVGCLTLAVGDLEVLIADGSGVYTLSAGKRNDTVYRREEEDTIEVKIPNPFIKPGFIP